MPIWTNTTNRTTSYASYVVKYLDGRAVCYYKDQYARPMPQAATTIILDRGNLTSQLKIALSERKTATAKPNMEETF